jgi:hypothetical protein
MEKLGPPYYLSLVNDLVMHAYLKNLALYVNIYNNYMIYSC